MEHRLEILKLDPWGGIDYEEALKRQLELARAGRSGWLLFCCPPTITLGRRADAADVLASHAALASRGIRVLEVDRGGEVTYHGPGQIIGFPFGHLEEHVGDARGVRAFVVGFKRALSRVIARHRTLDEATPDDEAGLWILDNGARRKIASIGLAFGREGIRHGFALNVQPLEDAFSLIHPCGARAAPAPASLFATQRGSDEFEAVIGHCIDNLGLQR